MAYDFRHRLHFYKNGTEYSTGLCTAKSDIRGISSLINNYLGMRLGQVTYYLGLGSFGSSNLLPLRVRHPNSTSNLQAVGVSLPINVKVTLKRFNSGLYDVTVQADCSYVRTEDLTIQADLQTTATSTPLKTYSDVFSALSLNSASRYNNEILNFSIRYVKVYVNGFGNQVWSNGSSISLPLSTGSSSKTITVQLM